MIYTYHHINFMGSGEEVETQNFLPTLVAIFKINSIFNIDYSPKFIFRLVGGYISISVCWCKNYGLALKI